MHFPRATECFWVPNSVPDPRRSRFQPSLDEPTFRLASIDNSSFRYVVIECFYKPLMDPLIQELLRPEEQIHSPHYEGFQLACRREGLWVAPNEPWSRAAIERNNWIIDLIATKVYNEWMEHPDTFRGLYPSDLRFPVRTRYVPFRYRQEPVVVAACPPMQLQFVFL